MKSLVFIWIITKLSALLKGTNERLRENWIVPPTVYLLITKRSIFLYNRQIWLPPSLRITNVGPQIVGQLARHFVPPDAIQYEAHVITTYELLSPKMVNLNPTWPSVNLLSGELQAREKLGN